MRKKKKKKGKNLLRPFCMRNSGGSKYLFCCCGTFRVACAFRQGTLPSRRKEGRNHGTQFHQPWRNPTQVLKMSSKDIILRLLSSIGSRGYF
ncbi:hypothetical protein N658DRAFT_247889 [Parathielavia hyrcaniae]|uniref:Uncharacterized protein n=1 Tax=Parathielavia hyrcaniae TaxID=113614 RepID=A0AAN6T4T1_9PEZI|nr:hypothetical protein N658DRAFT_247889 [Parathielavia hyrcaniae]